MRATPAIVMVALLLAGCAAEPSTETSTTATSTKAALSTPTATASGTSTTTTKAPTATATATASSTVAPVQAQTSTASAAKPPSVRTVSEQGYLPPGAVYLPIGGTAGMGAYAFGQDRWFDFDQAGTILGANLTMTWAAGVTNTDLQLTFTPIERDGAGGFYTGDTRFVTGPSPLVLELSGLDWTEGSYAVTAWWSNEVGTVVADETDFTILGEVYYR